MPCKDGTGPRGQGPMTGHSGGECMLKESEKDPGCYVGYAGTQGTWCYVKKKSGQLLDLFAPLLRQEKNETDSK